MRSSTVKKLLCVLCLVSALFLMTGCVNFSSAGYSAKIGDDSASATFSGFTDTKTYDLIMRAGETINAELKIESGSVKVTIARGDEAPIYEGDGSVPVFSAVCADEGTYTVTVTGDKAKGSVSFTRGE